jgi:predicted HicB family RNase H-like nuclease
VSTSGNRVMVEYRGMRTTLCCDCGVWCGKVEGVRSLLSFEGDTKVSAFAGFIETVDEYHEHCRELGVQPEKSQ